MAVPFDHMAPTYDSAFTYSAIGQLQRRHVWGYLEKALTELHGLEILELNCGTGEDAVLFGDRGFNIIATDVSEEMLKVADTKIRQHALQHKINSQYLDLDSFDEASFPKKFDLIFSNFGGLNCISPRAFKKLLSRIPSILSPGGRFIAVVMARHCLWETLYFILKLQPRKAFRRWTKKMITADLNGHDLKIWYYKPGEIKKWAAPAFSTARILPVGFTVPPSYLENFFRRKQKTLLLLNAIEKRISRFKMLASFSDHYIIDLKLKSKK